MLADGGGWQFVYEDDRGQTLYVTFRDGIVVQVHG
jgi:hypothetical protein